MKLRLCFLLFCLTSLLLTSCREGEGLDDDVKVFVDYQCQLKEIDAKQKAGELNFKETEDAKVPIFDMLDRIRRRNDIGEEKIRFDSLLVIEQASRGC